MSIKKVLKPTPNIERIKSVFSGDVLTRVTFDSIRGTSDYGQRKGIKQSGVILAQSVVSPDSSGNIALRTLIMITNVPSLVEKSGPISDPYNFDREIPRTLSSVGKVGSVSCSYRIILRS